jgi:hypothetical protein
MGRLLAAERSSEALGPIRESSGSHCPLHESQSAQLRPGALRWSIPPRKPFHHSTLPRIQPSHMPCPTQRTHAIGLWVAYQRNHLNSAFLRRWSRGDSQYRTVTMVLTVG